MLRRHSLSKRWNKGYADKFKAIAIISLLFLIFVVMNLGCTKNEAKVTEEKVMNVKVLAAEMKSFRPFVETIGSLKPNEEVIVSSEVDGIVKNLRVNEGSSVSKGMVLVEINETDYRLEVNRADAALRQAKASLANAKLEYERKASLYKEELVTKQQFDDISARLALADGELDRAKASLSLAKEKLSKTKIYSPLEGIVREKRLTKGDYVRNGSQLLWIVQTDPLKLSFTVPEKDMGKLKIGQDVLFKVDTYPDTEFKGRLGTIYPSLEEKTRTLQVEALVPNHDNRLKPGLFAKVTLYTGQARDIVVVPITAVLYEDSRVKVFIAEGERAKERPVKIGTKYGEYLEIVEGIQKGEMVVVAGQNNLAEGVKMNVAR
ncbi:MAG: efflux RND transporter periplasmic adaptor subunit [Deltaproteobacteria bacterium]|nr:efflux RND transporter periplasmic adaptor subunit [Deltaproteobacteria bacterium]